MLSFSSCAKVSLEKAREQREQARTLLANGTDPSADRKEQKQVLLSSAGIFCTVFDERQA